MSDPIEIMAPYFTSAESQKHPADVRARTMVAALDAGGWAIVPKEPSLALLVEADKAYLKLPERPGDEWPVSANLYRAQVEAGRLKP